MVTMCDALPIDRDLAGEQITEWLAKAIERHGEWFEVQKIPANENGPRNPLEELVEMVGPDRVAVVTVPAALEKGE